jgi:hypothetical protein
MPTKMRRLREEAMESTSFRGHTMCNWILLCPVNGCSFWRSMCVICGASVDVRIKPQPNECELAGEAISLGCWGA